MSYDSVILAENPVGYWNLADPSGTQAVDSSTNANYGTYSGGFTLGATPPGALDGAVSFDGSTGQVSIPNSAALAMTGNLTIECWCKPSSLPGTTEFLTKPYTSHTPPYIDYCLSGGRSGNFGFLLGSAGSYTLATGSAGEVSGQWYHVVGVYDGSDIRLYINGQLNVAPVACTGVVNTSGQSLYIGAPGTWTGENFPGAISSVAVYNTALSAAKVNAHYLAGLAAEPWNLRGNRPRPAARGVNPRWRAGLVYSHALGRGGPVRNLATSGTPIATLNGDASWGYGPFGPQVNFGGANGYLDCGLQSVLAGAVDVTASVLARSDTSSGGNQNYRMLVSDNSLFFYLYTLNTASIVGKSVGASNTLSATANAPNLFGWTLYTMRMRGGTTIDLFYGADKVATATGATAAITTGMDLMIGTQPANLASSWMGSIAAAHVWDRALSDVEVAALAADPFAPVRPPRLAPGILSATRPALAYRPVGGSGVVNSRRVVAPVRPVFRGR